MKENHRTWHLPTEWLLFFRHGLSSSPIFPELVLVELSLNFLRPALLGASSEMDEDQIVDAAWRFCWEAVDVFFFFFSLIHTIYLLDMIGLRPAASNRTQSGPVVALLPCAVGISCWSGTPGAPKGATGCWKISPCRPTSIRDLLA